MISARKDAEPANDSYGRLADYIAAADKGEKCLMSWPAGCWAGDDYELGIVEVKDTQALNTRTKKEKTYHLVISFRPEDEAKLTPEIYKAIEERFAAALGYSEHQRHCGVHQNTNNLHMHIAYNMIHPERLTRHEPFRDYHRADYAGRGCMLASGNKHVPVYRIVALLTRKTNPPLPKGRGGKERGTRRLPTKRFAFVRGFHAKSLTLHTYVNLFDHA